MDINSREAAEWSLLMKLTSEQEHKIVVLRDALRNLVERLDSHFSAKAPEWDWKEQAEARAILAEIG